MPLNINQKSNETPQQAVDRYRQENTIPFSKGLNSIAPPQTTNSPLYKISDPHPDLDKTMKGISYVETGREKGNPYTNLGPKTKSGAYAIGKYQIMSTNVPSWTKAATGKSMTPEEFKNNPQAQEQTAAYILNDYVKKYGMDNAASMWLSGRTIKNAGHAKDSFGTDVPTYLKVFHQGIDKSSSPTSAPYKPMSNNLSTQPQQSLSDRLGNALRNPSTTTTQPPSYRSISPDLSNGRRLALDSSDMPLIPAYVKTPSSNVKLPTTPPIRGDQHAEEINSELSRIFGNDNSLRQPAGAFTNNPIKNNGISFEGSPERLLESPSYGIIKNVPELSQIVNETFSGKLQNPVDIAERYAGLTNTDPKSKEILSDIFNKSLGTGKLDPEKVGYCGLFVNTILKQSGRAGMGSNIGSAFAEYGTPTKVPQRGDIVMTDGGSHVGFFVGKDGNNPGNILMLGGNQVSENENGDINTISVPEKDVFSYSKLPQGNQLKSMATKVQESLFSPTSYKPAAYISQTFGDQYNRSLPANNQGEIFDGVKDGFRSLINSVRSR